MKFQKKFENAVNKFVDIAKTVLRVKCIANAYIRTEVSNQSSKPQQHRSRAKEIKESIRKK